MHYLKKLDLLFSDRYVNTSAVGSNFILLWMYKLSYPLSLLLGFLNLTPNQITTMSFIAAVVACSALIFHEGWLVFAIFWIISVVLDLCDGTVARMKEKKSISAFRYDHMSDLFKIYLLTLAISLHFMDITVWILAITTSSLYLYNMVLIHDLQRYARPKLISNEAGSTDSKVDKTRLRHRFPIIGYVVKFPFIMRLYKVFHSIFLTVSGHTYFLFFLLPIDISYTIVMLGYLTLLSIFNIVLNIKELNSYIR